MDRFLVTLVDQKISEKIPCQSMVIGYLIFSLSGS